MKVAADHFERSYRIEPGDTLHSLYPLRPELDQDMLVHPDGRMTATGIGPLMVGGLDTAQLAALLREKSSSLHLRDPEVAVSIRRLDDKTVYVGGEVGRHPIYAPRRSGRG